MTVNSLKSVRHVQHECPQRSNKDVRIIIRNLVGREEYLRYLWKWLLDKYVPIKLLTGLGGVGKTTIAREFSEYLIINSPMGFERVIWLSAKKQFYTAIKGEYEPTTRVDFSDIKSLLMTLLTEVGWPKDQIDLEWSREELIEQVVTTLIEIPVFVVIDDVDSLEVEDQHDVFQTMALVFGQTIGRANVESRALLTARLDLGAAPPQFKVVNGLEFEEFVEYVEMTAKSIELKLNFESKSKIMKRFHKDTDGTPTFASSIIRLLRTGENIMTALSTWKGADGEEVRKFAFKKELENLNDSQLRTLYAACILGETSLLELKQITLCNERLLRDDIVNLRQYHLLALGSEIPAGGSRLIVPSSIRLMNDIIKERLKDPKRIEEACAKIRKESPKLGGDVGNIVHRVVALWKEDNPTEALEVARYGNKKEKDNADLKCLLGRAYLKIDPADYRRADGMFRRAYELKCKRPELAKLWIYTKRNLGDWMGMIEVTKIAENLIPGSDYTYIRVQACAQVGDIASRSGNLISAAEYYLKGAVNANETLRKNIKLVEKRELHEVRQILLTKYISTIDPLSSDPNQDIDVWLAILEAFRNNVYLPEFLAAGVEKLISWWGAVEDREIYDNRAIKLLEVQLQQLEKYIGIFENEKHAGEAFMYNIIENTKNLYEKKAKYEDRGNFTNS